MSKLIEITMCDDTISVYTLGMGVSKQDLSEEELRLFEASKAYLKEKEYKRNEELVKLAREDFEKLRDIPNMPDEAIYILKQWTSRYEDDYDYEDYDIDE